MNAFVGVGLLCIVTWAILVYGAGVGSGLVHIALALGFVLVARGLITPRRD